MHKPQFSPPRRTPRHAASMLCAWRSLPLALIGVMGGLLVILNGVVFTCGLYTMFSTSDKVQWLKKKLGCGGAEEKDKEEENLFYLRLHKKLSIRI